MQVAAGLCCLQSLGLISAPYTGQGATAGAAMQVERTVVSVRASEGREVMGRHAAKRVTARSISKTVRPNNTVALRILCNSQVPSCQLRAASGKPQRSLCDLENGSCGASIKRKESSNAICEVTGQCYIMINNLMTFGTESSCWFYPAKVAEEISRFAVQNKQKAAVFLRRDRLEQVELKLKC